MTFLVSPGVDIEEFDLTTVVPAIAATPAAIAGVFHWGPMQQRVLIDSENMLVKRFGKPSNFNGETWFTAASYLAYGSFLYVVRTGDTTGNTIEHTGATLVSGNSVVLMANTAGIANGMKLFSSNVSALSANHTGGIYVTSTNTTAIILSSAPTGAAANADLIFRDNIVFTAVAQETPVLNLSWALYNVTNPTVYGNLDGSFDASILYLARYPGSKGNSLRVSVCGSASQFVSNAALIANAQINATATNISAIVGSNTLTVTIKPADTSNATNVTAANVVAGLARAQLSVGDIVQVGNSDIGLEFMKIDSISVVALAANVFSFTIQATDPYTLVANTTSNTLNRYWEFYNLTGRPPGQSTYVQAVGNTSANDEMHIVVVDENGVFSGTPGTVLEVYKAVSRATDAKNNNNTTNYYKNVINQQSQYIWWANDRSTAPSATAAFVASGTGTAPLNMQMTGGDDGLDESVIPLGNIVDGYDMFASAEDVDIGLIITGKARGEAINSNTQLASWLINNIATLRKDCVVFCSPDIDLVVDNVGDEAADIVTARNTMPSTSYAFMDSGYKKMYDRYNDVYRWIPLNGDMAGLAAQTDKTNAAWWSFAGFNRGNVKNVVKLAWNPRESERDTLYTAQVNPVVRFPGLGTVLYGDKTMLDKPSSFNRINVRRLFIVLEKSIATAAKFSLFEFNDEFTRTQFKAMVKPFLQDVMSRRGITGFEVRCDKTNNTAQVIQNNEFIADLFIRPNYSINWIKLNFISVPPTISFAEAESIQY